MAIDLVQRVEDKDKQVDPLPVNEDTQERPDIPMEDVQRPTTPQQSVTSQRPETPLLRSGAAPPSPRLSSRQSSPTSVIMDDDTELDELVSSSPPPSEPSMPNQGE